MAATGGFPGQPTGESSGQDVPPSTPPQAVAPHPTMWTVQAANGDVHTFDTEQEANDSADGGSVIPPQPE